MILLAINKIRYSGKKYLLLERTPHQRRNINFRIKNILWFSTVNILSVSNINCIGFAILNE